MKEPDRLAFAARLKAARESAGWTQDGAAIALGMNRVAYGDYERGKRVPSVLRLMEIVRVLELDPKVIVPEWFTSPSGTPAKQTARRPASSPSP